MVKETSCLNRRISVGGKLDFLRVKLIRTQPVSSDPASDSRRQMFLFQNTIFRHPWLHERRMMGFGARQIKPYRLLPGLKICGQHAGSVWFLGRVADSRSPNKFYSSRPVFRRVLVLVNFSLRKTY